ncbi:50S ribosomal protein L5 [Brachyspira hyodysenteriae]|uniref:Large ribosomal subunit protein uL5 n=4 Tax=Brachyspira TaxID=29521 RepID=RL5_BRAHW|nr:MULTISPECIES: 50S ribosomal protein L5 [Brachyspira]C0QW08.1 RecName: Full=Large ribosomal subunit protein uL5; AltName: Full=50S ribosomal protein L5 [Brachyspira hyodysenteriae WA1]ACN84594.1 50S ribosomal protein L5 [Brachyspira hyodysenteriae WA1]ANN63331.1 50S ribosomal protein L5 [Brachyspira hyodysenteriae ATCC 27164]AUJ50326.1 50S ribosomal protein L5 [Brachyspira hyodysenteriae]KLI13853.1 50S ribosomal protein L5 [Brachyspira hyodysenteriae]KLI14535.1 50S ribosomal protein L5 [Bra
MSVLKDRYENEIKQSLLKDMNLSSTMAIPKIEKIIINMGVTQAVTDKKYVDSAVEELSQIAGQRAVVTRAKKSIANFKLRQGMPIGCRVTLRGERMYDFLERLIFIALPRVRDFQGIPRRGFDGNGNYNLGIKEHTIFPEISFDKTDAVKGLNITIVTTADNDDMARTLLERVGLPFRAAPKSQENK